MVSDINECSTYDTINIEEPLPLTFGFNYINPSCNNFSDGSISIGINGGVSPYNASFNNNIPSSIINDSIFFSNLSSASDIIQVIDQNGCISEANLTLVNPLLLEVKSNSETNPTCYNYSNGTSTIEAMGGTSPYSYFVFDNNGLEISNLSNTTNLSAGNYEYKIIDVNGCEVSIAFEILNPEEISIYENTIVNVNCFDQNTGSILVDVDNTVGNYQIFWSDLSQDSIFINDLYSGLYISTVIDENNCTKVDSFEVIQSDEIIADFSTINASCAKIADGIINIENITGGLPPYNIYINSELVSENIMMSMTLENVSANRNEPSYNIEIIDNLNCVINQDIIVDFDGGYGCIDEPVIISPNGDGINDIWQPILDVDTDIEVNILNRWGILEYYYKGNSTTFKWNGISDDGYLLPSADYYFIIKFNNISLPDRTGAITLIR